MLPRPEDTETVCGKLDDAASSPSISFSRLLMRASSAAVEEAVEEALAKSLGAVPNNVGQHARYVLKRRIGKRYVHFAHHIGFTNSAHHEVSALNAELVASLFSAGRWGYEPPAILVRSHSRTRQRRPAYSIRCFKC